MSIYAKTVMSTMPGSCTECKLGERYGYVGDVKCRILREYFTGNVEPPYKERPDECPLVELTTPSNSPRKPETPEIDNLGVCGCTGKPCSECQPGPCEHRRQEVN